MAQEIWIRWAWVLGLTCLLSTDAQAFPAQPGGEKWATIIRSLEDVPFTHRIYGDLDAEVMRVIDGDTLYVEIPTVHPLIGYEIGVRVYGIDTRELNDSGESSKEFVTSLLPPGRKITLKNLRRGKYFRIVGDVILPGGSSLADILLEKKLAYPYYGGTKRPRGWRPEDYEGEEGTEGK